MWKKIKLWFSKPVVDNYRSVDGTIVVDVADRGKEFKVFITPSEDPNDKEHYLYYYKFNTFLEDGTSVYWDDRISNSVWKYVGYCHSLQRNKELKNKLNNVVKKLESPNG